MSTKDTKVTNGNETLRVPSCPSWTITSLGSLPGLFAVDRFHDLTALASGFATRRGFADATHTPHRRLIDRPFLLRMSVRDSHCFAGIGSIKIGPDFFAQAFGSLVDPAAAHDLHFRTAV